MLKRRIYLISFLILSLSLIIITPYSIAAQSFPDSFSDVTMVKYSFKQEFSHSNPDLVSGDAYGSITIDVSKNVLNQLNFSIQFDLDVFYKGCDPSEPDPYYLDKKLGLIVDPLTRYVENVYMYTADYIPDTLYDPHYTSYFLNNPELVSEGSLRYMTRDELFLFRQVMVSSFFENKGVVYIDLYGQDYKTLHLRNESLLVYQGSICGLGTGIGINATVDYYYEYGSGILLKANSYYKEFYALDPEIYQEHYIEKKIIELDYLNEPSNSTGFSDPNDDKSSFWSITENKIGTLVITGIIIGTIAVFFYINKIQIKWKFEALRNIENIEEKLKKEISELKQELKDFEKERENRQFPV